MTKIHVRGEGLARFRGMTLLPILYWLILILSVVGAFGPSTWPVYFRFLPIVALLVIIGLRIFRIPLQ